MSVDASKQPPTSVIERSTTAARITLVAVAGSRMLRYDAPPSGVVTIGRSKDADLQIDDDSVSRLHARLVIEPDRLTVEDLRSCNGTFHFGRMLAGGEVVEVALHDVLRLGSAVLTIEPTADVPLAREPMELETERGVVVHNRGMREVYRLARTVARSGMSVIVTGATGVGKEHVAELIHQHSDRRAEPFVRINCAAFTETLFESEFFGYEKGAFTGAQAAKPGLLEHAGGGTIFLDELGEMPLAIQAKLLRVLEERRVMRVGALTPRPVHARFIAATNRSLADEIARGRFRKDLFYRLAGIELAIPSLRERPDEILPLVEMFARAAAAQLGRDVAPGLHQTTAVALCEYPWPGNVRELRNVIERAVLLSDGGTIGVDHLLLPEVNHPDEHELDEDPQLGASQPRERLMWALAKTSGNQKEAARLLGVSRRTVTNWLDRYRVARPRKGRPPS